MVVLLTVNWNQYLLLIYLFIYCKNIWTWSLLKYFPCVDCVNYGLIPHQRMFCLWINFIQLIHRQSQLPSTVTTRCSGTHLMLLQWSNVSALIISTSMNTYAGALAYFKNLARIFAWWALKQVVSKLILVLFTKPPPIWLVP